MKRFTLALVIAVLAAACSGPDSQESEPIDTSGVHAATIAHPDVQRQFRGKDLVYAAGPSVEAWDLWCGGAGIAEDAAAACEVIDSTELHPPTAFVAPEADEITGALTPATVEFIEDRESVIEPFEEGMMLAPIKNGAGLLTFGVAVEASGKIYLPVDGHGEGWLFVATPTDSGWEIEVIASWIV